MPRQLFDLTAEELRSYDRTSTVIILTVGVIEDFGPHIKIGFPFERSKVLAQKLAEKIEKDKPGWKSLVLSSPMGVDSVTTSVSFPIRPHVVRDWLVDYCEGLAKMGFSYFVCVSGSETPKQLTAIEEAGKTLDRRFRFKGVKRRPVFLSASSALTDAGLVKKAPFFAMPDEHGGRDDTSVAMHIGMTKGNPESIEKINPAPQNIISWAFRRMKKDISGYWGSPSRADPDEGVRVLNEKIGRVTERLYPVLEGRNPRSQFRSWYSVVPMNWSFFKSWVLILCFFLLMLAWVYFSLSQF